MKTNIGVTVVIPVKPWALAKSRLDVGNEARGSLARAFVLDVIDAVSSSALVRQIVLVTAEHQLGAVAARVGAVVLTDQPVASADGLDVAVDCGRQWAMRWRPTSPIVVVPGDLPALTTASFNHGVNRLSLHAKAFVPDAVGQGTTLTWAWLPSHLQTSYGPRSAVAHTDAGFHPVVDVDPRTRRDVDTLADLAEAQLLGLGSHTAAAVNHFMSSRAGVRCEHPARALSWL